MKKIRFLLVFIIVSFFVLGLIWYFAYPIKIQNIMKHIDETEKVDFLIYSDFDHYSIQFNDKTNISEMIDILNSASYRREFKSYKGSTDRIIMMIIFYRNKDGAITNYSFDINESGKIISNNMQYQMNGDTREIFNNLYEWIKSNGIYIPNPKQ